MQILKGNIHIMVNMKKEKYYLFVITAIVKILASECSLIIGSLFFCGEKSNRVIVIFQDCFISDTDFSTYCLYIYNLYNISHQGGLKQ